MSRPFSGLDEELGNWGVEEGPGGDDDIIQAGSIEHLHVETQNSFLFIKQSLIRGLIRHFFDLNHFSSLVDFSFF